MNKEKLSNYNSGDMLRILFVRSGGHFMEVVPPDAPMIGPPKSIIYLAGVFKDDPSVQMRFLDILASADFEKVLREKENPPIYFGMSDDNIVSYVNDFKPHIIAVTSTANYFFNETIKFIDLVGSILPSAFMIVGGPDATNDYHMYFEKAKGIDCVIMREGEVTFKNVVSALRDKLTWKDIRGIVYIDDGNIIRNEDQPYIDDLDSLACNYDIVDLERYFEINKLGYPSRLIFKYPGSHRSIDLVTSRGCPYNCSFCCIHLHMGKSFRPHSASHVLAEMKYLIEKHDVRNFHFEDDNLLDDKERFLSFLRGIVDNAWNITWDTPNGIRADQVDSELLELCRKTGCTYLIFGVESGSIKVHDEIINKNLDLDDVINACRLCYEYEIDTLAFYIFGLPGETKEDLQKTYSFAFDMFKKYNTTPIFQLWRPYRNTDIEMKVRQTSNIRQKDIISLYKEFGIPHTLFYSQVYEDGEITMNFLSSIFNNYLKDVEKYAFINWLKIARRKPLVLVKSLLQVMKIFMRAFFSPSSGRSKLRQYLVSSGMMPFSMIHGLGRKK